MKNTTKLKQGLKEGLDLDSVRAAIATFVTISILASAVCYLYSFH